MKGKEKGSATWSLLGHADPMGVLLALKHAVLLEEN